MELEKFWFFESLDEQEITELKSITVNRKYKKGDILFYAKDEPKYLHLLASGVAKLYIYDFKDNEVVLHNLCAPNLIAEIANFEESPYPANCSFESDAEIYLIDYKKFKEKFLSKTEISMVFIKSLTKKIKALESFINYSITADSYTKIAKFLYENESILKSLKQIKIASILNIAPETLSRNVTKLKKEKIIDKDGGYIKIIDHGKLKELIA
ncbi:Crp/Fnr family transcriptional regulator [Sulfurimonas sp. HSL-1716]|uniref:Crp/Fnr family transcriptional regulator n=1 Tax=Hydrocurvibacter sulfurireducens TaxID=3131937 RepID=UPI0031F74CAF